MFLRQSHRQNKNGSVTAYYFLAESVRVSGKKNPANRIVHNFGRADKVDVEFLKRLVDSINRVNDGAGGSDPSDVKSFEEFLLSQRLGVPLVASSIFESMRLGEITGSRISKKVRNGPDIPAILAMIAHRLDDPGSKRSCCEKWLEEVWLPEGDDLNVEQLYRALDVLAEHGEDIENEVFWRGAEYASFMAVIPDACVRHLHELSEFVNCPAWKQFQQTFWMAG